MITSRRRGRRRGERPDLLGDQARLGEGHVVARPGGRHVLDEADEGAARAVPDEYERSVRARSGRAGPPGRPPCGAASGSSARSFVRTAGSHALASGSGPGRRTLNQCVDPGRRRGTAGRPMRPRTFLRVGWFAANGASWSQGCDAGRWLRIRRAAVWAGGWERSNGARGPGPGDPEHCGGMTQAGAARVGLVQLGGLGPGRISPEGCCRVVRTARCPARLRGRALP